MQKTNYDQIVDLIIDKKIIALFQGRSEAGARALGNRSILFDPRVKEGKDIVNTVKKREYFRPFGCTILLEHAHEWFDMENIKESPFMMYAISCKKDKIALLHIDNTCRLQTIAEKQNYHFYNVIKSFYKRTDVPCLLNTSFNMAGEPLVNTLEQAEETFLNTKIDCLWLPERNEIRDKKEMI
jgi:carbamoyltransferase